MHLWDKHRIVITEHRPRQPRRPDVSYRALRVTPNIYTPLEEIDTFVDAMRTVTRPGTAVLHAEVRGRAAGTAGQGGDAITHARRPRWRQW